MKTLRKLVAILEALAKSMTKLKSLEMSETHEDLEIADFSPVVCPNTL